MLLLPSPTRGYLRLSASQPAGCPPLLSHAQVLAISTTTTSTAAVDSEPTTSQHTAAAQYQRHAAQPRPVLTGKQIEEAAMWKQIALHEAHPPGSGGAPRVPLKWSMADLASAFEKCGVVTSEYAKTFYLGTQLMTPDKARAIWAIYVWCRRTDELVDGPNASKITPAALDRWEQRLEALFEGRPYDALDAALTDTISRFPLDIQPFRDMIGGMRMDLVKSRCAEARPGTKLGTKLWSSGAPDGSCCCAAPWRSSVSCNTQHNT